MEDNCRQSDAIDANNGSNAPFRFSVVVPTYQRRDLAVASMGALARQAFDKPFEAIVVVDGSQDGTAQALRRLELPYPLTVIEQRNRGASVARNRGAAAARGEIILFLDDDMEADPNILAELDRSHNEGHDVVFGHLPLHPNSPANFLSSGIGQWTDGRLARLMTPGERLTLHDLMTGQMSLSRELFHRVGGFDTQFTLDGSFGDEDIDFGYRMMRDGYRLGFNPKAISYQNYIVQPRHYLRQWHQAGSADVSFARKHPEQSETIFTLNGKHKPTNRWLWRPLVALAPLSTPLTFALKWLALKWVSKPKPSDRAIRFFYQIHAMEYWRGVAKAGGMPRPRPLRVLAYHAIRDLAGTGAVEPYGVPPDQFRRHIDLLKRAGFHFVSPGEVLQFLRYGGGLPRRPLLLTFDDAYAELREVTLPLLRERGIPAIVFAVSGQVGGTNDWDQSIGAPRLPLLDADGLRELAAGGMKVGAHSRNHRELTKVPDAELSAEIDGCLDDFEKLGLGRPETFAYPYGEYDQRVSDQVSAAGLKVAFTVVPGLARAGQHPFQIPRIEILREDTGWRFLWKVWRAGRWATRS